MSSFTSDLLIRLCYVYFICVVWCPVLSPVPLLPLSIQVDQHTVLMLSDGCIDNMTHLLECTLVQNICDIVGYSATGDKLLPLTAEQLGTETVNQRLVKRGLAWAAHVNEPWNCMIIAGVYIFFSVTLALPLWGLLGDLVVKIIRSAANDNWVIGDPSSYQEILPRVPSIMRNQNIGYTLAGLVLQIADALWFIFLLKIVTWAYRWVTGRPMWARMGKRTIVIVDTPVNHQLLENFVSKLYSQAYSFCSVDVHGSSGLDHFVHRFTHRVVRGVLLAVGRPDGRVCCLAKSEAAVLLAAKQAAFIRNPWYEGRWYDSSGPEFVTIGHNPFQVGASGGILYAFGVCVGVYVWCCVCLVWCFGW